MFSEVFYSFYNADIELTGVVLFLSKVLEITGDQILLYFSCNPFLVGLAAWLQWNEMLTHYFNNNNLFMMKKVQKSLIHKNSVYHSVWFFPNLMVNCSFVNSETINDYFLINFVSLSFIFLIFTIHQFLNLLNSLGQFSPRIALSFIPHVLIFNLFLNLYSQNYYQIHLLILRLLIFVFLL